MNNSILASLMHLLTQAPLVIACLTGLILAAAFWQRYPGPCSLLAGAMILELLIIFINPVVTQYVIQTYLHPAYSQPNGVNWAFTIMALAFSFLHASVLGLLVTAGFLGRGVAS